MGHRVALAGLTCFPSSRLVRLDPLLELTTYGQRKLQATN